MFFGLFGKKEPPILRAGMLEPVDALISTAEAKRIFKEWMLKIGHLDRQEVGDHVGYFADAIKDHEEYLKMESDHEKDITKEEIPEEKEYLKEAKRDLSKCKDDSQRAELQSDVSACEETIERHTAQLADHGKPLNDFKKDKREFLVSYINDQVHGSDWRTKV